MRRFIIPLLLLLCTVPLAALSVTGGTVVDSFESVDNLARFDFQNTEGLNDSYLDDVTVSLVTQAPGKEVYVWFGHAGLMVSTPLQDVMYDWGVFSFGPGFYTDFLFGRLYYNVYPTSARSSLLRAVDNQRTVRVLELPLTNAAKNALLSFVNYNTRPENMTYLYHYYLDNCATRIRDIVNAATDGDFQSWAESVQTGMSFRDFSSLYMERSLLVSFTLNALQGPSIDHPLNLYEACFLPDVLMAALEDYYGAEAQTVYQGPPAPVGDNHLLLSSLTAGLIMMIILHTLSRSNKRAYGVVAFVLYLYLAVLSSILLFVMTFTNHDVSWNNENILFLNPLIFILLIQAAARIIRKDGRLNASIMTSRILLSLALADLVLKGLWPTVFIQDNFPLLAFLIPVYLSLAIQQKEKTPPRHRKQKHRRPC